MKQTDRTLKALLALLIVSVWGIILRPLVFSTPVQAQGQVPSAVGRYVMQVNGGYTYVLDTATGTIKATWTNADGVHTITQTWDKDYASGTETIGPVSKPAPPAPK